MKRMLVLVLAILPELGTTARAQTQEPPTMAILVGPGIRKAWLERPGGYPTADQVLPAIVATIGYRVSQHASVGTHGSIARFSDHEDFAGSMDFETEDWNVIATDVGVAASYEEDRFTVTPWVGRHFSRRQHDSEFCTFRNGTRCSDTHITEWTSDYLSYGLIASVVPLREIPVAVFIDLQGGTGGAVLGPETMPRYSYSALTIGVAYRR